MLHKIDYGPLKQNSYDFLFLVMELELQQRESYNLHKRVIIRVENDQTINKCARVIKKVLTQDDGKNGNKDYE